MTLQGSFTAMAWQWHIDGLVAMTVKVASLICVFHLSWQVSLQHFIWKGADAGSLSLKLFSLKTLEITCRFICFRVKRRFQPINLGLGGHHVLLETSKRQYLIPCHTSYSRGVLRPGTNLPMMLLAFCHCTNHSVLSPKTNRIFKSACWHWCSINTFALWEGIIPEPSWRTLEQL